MTLYYTTTANFPSIIRVHYLISFQIPLLVETLSIIDLSVFRPTIYIDQFPISQSINHSIHSNPCFSALLAHNIIIASSSSSLSLIPRCFGMSCFRSRACLTLPYLKTHPSMTRYSLLSRPCSVPTKQAKHACRREGLVIIFVARTQARMYVCNTT